jgi:hypothetical protein
VKKKEIIYLDFEVMINFKKMDDKDFVFINKPLSEKEEKAFSDFLKLRKRKVRRTSTSKKDKILSGSHS